MVFMRIVNELCKAVLSFRLSLSLHLSSSVFLPVPLSLHFTPNPSLPPSLSLSTSMPSAGTCVLEVKVGEHFLLWVQQVLE